MDALRPLGMQSVPGCIPTQSVGTISDQRCVAIQINNPA
ncbi:hypothetical protein HNR03_000707 [Pseudomonas sp. JAI111]|nr:hypothetical protein [Pseudomonas sp. JAI111]